MTQPGRLHCLGQCGLSSSRRVAQVASHGGLSCNERPASSPRPFSSLCFYISLAKANHVAKFRWKSPFTFWLTMLSDFELLSILNYLIMSLGVKWEFCLLIREVGVEGWREKFSEERLWRVSAFAVHIWLCMGSWQSWD